MNFPPFNFDQMNQSRALKTKKLMQFKIVLLDVEPAIWRRIQVPQNFTFQQFHMAIQDAMGWFDHHLHSFSIPDSKNLGQTIEIGLPNEQFCEDNIKDETSYLIKNCFKDMVTKIDYQYDFGDSWEHEIIYEGLHNAKSKGPICIGGKNPCPPEDIGGSCGFMEFLDVMRDPDNDEYEENDSWYKNGRNGCNGKSFKLGKFNKNRVKFRKSRRGCNY